MDNNGKPSKYELGEALLDIGALLMVSGANTERIKITINRISEVFGCKSHLLITNHALMITLIYQDKNKVFTSVKRIPGLHLNFNVISEISIMSWKIVGEKWTLEQINTALTQLNLKALYSRLTILFLVALAGASFCRLAGGELIEMLVCFAGSFLGMFVRQEAVKARFNYYLCIIFAAATSSFVAGLYAFLFPNLSYVNALSTSVLFLIPGVPMINSFSDLIDGNILNGSIRGVNVLIIAFSISMGLMFSILIFNLN